jgi:UDP-3-O-[3-hydroxymyristoyl] N-acetylglucosamine deacetylase/3-hydroxyacyl-[acyl-carrier-protein] dehydratase
MKQKTIQKSVSLSGKGLHTGKNATLSFKPAPINHGFKFVRIDVDSNPVISADVKNVLSTNRGTTLRVGEYQVSTVEHALSALVGMGLDNVVIEIDGPEVPIMDGSAKDFTDLIINAGIEEQEAEREIFEIEDTISYLDEVTGTELIAIPSDHFELTALIDFDSPILGQQYASLEDIADYKSEISTCRTFVFVHEIEKLISANLIKGGSMDNAIVIADKHMDKDEIKLLGEKLGKKNLKLDKQGVLNTVDLQFQNEPARHKLLDVIGDLALLGKHIKGKIMAKKPGHSANVAFAKILKQKFLEQRKLKGKPKYDPNQEPIFNVEQITGLIPHRHPFLLVDKIIELSSNHVVGIKNVTFDSFYFKGHFPNNPVFPGVLQIEALAQTGGILALSQVPDPENWDTYFIKIDNTKFKHKVVPGDTIILKMELMSPIRRGICHMYGTAYVGNKIVSAGELTAQILKRN